MTTTATGLSKVHKELLATTINNLTDANVVAEPSDIKRACLNDSTVWVEFTGDRINGKIAFPLQALAQTMKDFESVQEPQAEDAQEATTKLAEEVQVNDTIVVDGVAYKVGYTERRQYGQQVGRCSMNVIDFKMHLVPESFRYTPYEGESYSEGYWKHEASEARRYRDAIVIKYFNPCDVMLCVEGKRSHSIDLTLEDLKACF